MMMRITFRTKMIIFEIIIQCTDKLANAKSINAPLQQGKRKKFPLLDHLKKCQRSFLRNWVKALSKSASYVKQQLSEMPSPPWLRCWKNECNTRQTSYVKCICQNCRLFFLLRWWKIDVIRDFLWTVDVLALPSVSSPRLDGEKVM